MEGYTENGAGTDVTDRSALRACAARKSSAAD